MNKPKTYVTIILDKSGSMGDIRDFAIKGFNEKIQQLKEDAKTQEIYCSLITFNANVFEHLWNVPAEQLQETNAEEYVPIGGTAMLDAVGYATQKLLDTTDYNDPNCAYLVEVITDGQTNSDKHYSSAMLKELTKGCEATNRWTFTYSGCSKEYMESLSVSIGVPVSNMAAWSNSSQEQVTRGFNHMKNRQAKYFQDRSMGIIKTANYSSDVESVADYTVDESVSLSGSVSLSSTNAPVHPVESALQAQPATPPVTVPTPVAVTGQTFEDIMKRQPKYEKFANNSYNGGSVFANSQVVTWQK